MYANLLPENEGTLELTAKKVDQNGNKISFIDRRDPIWNETLPICFSKALYYNIYKKAYIFCTVWVTSGTKGY
jgi:hypothetical protein